MLPLFAAVDSTCSATDADPPQWAELDIITERNNLRKLLTWAAGNSTSKANNFRIDVELVGARTVLLRQWDERTHSRPNDSYGFSFEEHTTVSPPGSNSSYYRIIEYVSNYRVR